MAVGQFPNINIIYTSQYGEHNRTRVYFFFQSTKRGNYNLNAT